MSSSVSKAMPCCCSNRPVEESLSKQLFCLLERVSAVALGALSAYVSMELFLSYFLIGAGIGIYQSIFTPAEDRVASRRSVSCSQGLLEQLTGAKLPPLVSLISNLAITWCHIEHHTSIFVPVIAVSLGAWAGQKMGELPVRAAL